MRQGIRDRLKTIIIQSLRIEDLTPDEMRDDHQLLGGDLAVDSIDMLQLVLEVERSFGIRIVAGEFNRAEWQTIDTLAAAIESKLNAAGSAPR